MSPQGVEPRRLAVVGAGWAGLAAAVVAVEAGHTVTLYEMAAHAGGRARRVDHDGYALDNGQHILIGAYRETLALMRRVGIDPDAVLERRPLTLCDPHGRGLALPPGRPVPAFVRAVLALDHWPLRERGALLAAALRWRLGGFVAPASQTVAELARDLPLRARRELIDPLCVAALNTPSATASARVFLRVLRDALFGGRGAADLLLPRLPLGDILPAPALKWLEGRGADVRLASRVERLERHGVAWSVDGSAHDAVVLACTPVEAARLAAPRAPEWARVAAAFAYEPIVTAYLLSPGTHWARPMVTLDATDEQPAQFAFDLGALGVQGNRDGLFAFVVSGARAWVERGLDATGAAVIGQAMHAFPSGAWARPPTLLRVMAERRATFQCTPDVRRPPTVIAPGLAAAGDYVEGPYPATLEGAVRSASAALSALGVRAAAAFSPSH